MATNLKNKMIDLEYRILFVCMGNICRSPTAEAVFYKRLMDRKLLHKVKIDSAGTHNFHPDKPPDERSQAHALKRGYDLSHLRARPVVDSDFEQFDLLLTMDWDNRALLEERCPAQHLHKIRGLAEFLQTSQAPVIPDPYYGGYQGFEHVLDLIEEASEGLMKFVLGLWHGQQACPLSRGKNGTAGHRFPFLKMEVFLINLTPSPMWRAKSRHVHSHK